MLVVFGFVIASGSSGPLVLNLLSVVFCNLGVDTGRDKLILM